MVLPHNAYIKANIIDTTPGQKPDKCPSSTQNAAAWSTFPISRNRLFFCYSHNVGEIQLFPLMHLWEQAFASNSRTMLSPLDKSMDGEIK